MNEVVVGATTLRQVFAEAALAVFALGAEAAAVKAAEVREVRAHGRDLESLLTHWIGECCYVQDVEGFNCRTIDFSVFDVEPKGGGEPMRLHALLHGDVDDSSAPSRAALSVREITIRHGTDGYEVRMRIG
jgi:SHS2 domain-containing protein